MSSRWAQIGILWFIGVLAAAQLAKMAVLAPALRNAFQLSLAQLGLLISLLEVGGASLGFVAGLLIGRFEARRFLLAGLLVLALSGTTEALADQARLLFAARAVEGIGYVLVVVAAPTMIATAAGERERTAALALWSTFVPVGMALGSWVTGVAAVPLGLGGMMLAWAAMSAVALALALRLPTTARGGPRRLALPAAAAWLSAASFGLYTTLVCALTALLPIYLVDRLGATLPVASAVAACVSLAALPGCAAMIVLMRRRPLGSRLTLLVSALALAASAGPAAMVFGGGSSPMSVATSGALALAAVLLGGFAPPLIMARLPLLSGADVAEDPRLAMAQGLLTQFGAAGALIGPPLGGMVVGTWGWASLGPAVAGLTVAMLVVLGAAEWPAGRGARTATGPNGMGSSAC